jgi:hypothetical protein
LTRCHNANFLFLVVLYFRKVVQEIFLELDETKAEVNIFRNEDRVQKEDEEEAQGGQTMPWCGVAWARNKGWCGPPWPPPTSPLRLFIHDLGKTLKE